MCSLSLVPCLSIYFMRPRWQGRRNLQGTLLSFSIAPIFDFDLINDASHLTPSIRRCRRYPLFPSFEKCVTYLCLLFYFIFFEFWLGRRGKVKCAKQDKDWRGQLIGDMVFWEKLRLANRKIAAFFYFDNTVFFCEINSY